MSKATEYLICSWILLDALNGILDSEFLASVVLELMK